MSNNWNLVVYIQTYLSSSAKIHNFEASFQILLITISCYYRIFFLKGSFDFGITVHTINTKLIWTLWFPPCPRQSEVFEIFFTVYHCVFFFFLCLSFFVFFFKAGRGITLLCSWRQVLKMPDLGPLVFLSVEQR